MGEDEGRSDKGSDETGDGEEMTSFLLDVNNLRQASPRYLTSQDLHERRILRRRAAVRAGQAFGETVGKRSVIRERNREIEEKARGKLRLRGARTKHRYAFRPVAADDLPSIAVWLRRPHVARWWSDPAEQIETLRRNLAEPGFEALVMLLDGRRVGYLQVYDASPGTAGATAAQPPGTWGLDLFIGEIRALGRGHGPAFLRRIAARLLSDPGVRRVIADPDPGNRRSLRCLEKAGFRRGRLIRQPWGLAVLMVFTKGDLV